MTANKTAEPRIVNVEYTPSKTWHTIKMTRAACAIVTWSNGSRTALHDDEARSMYRRWQREQEAAA